MLFYSLYAQFRRAYAGIPAWFGNGWALPPLRVTLELTYRCNLRCQMCYLLHQEDVRHESDGRSRQAELTTEEIKGLIRQLPRFCFLTFTGGEPLLRPDLPELLAASSRHNQSALISNGFLITRELAGELVKIRPRLVAISVDGLEPTHDRIRGVPHSFKRATEALGWLKEHREKSRQRFPLLEMKTVITENNLDELEDLFMLAERLGVDALTFQMLSTSVNMNGLFLSPEPTFNQPPGPIVDFPVDRLREQLSSCLQRAARSRLGFRIIPPLPLPEVVNHYQNQTNLRDYYCHWPWSMTRINPFGEVYPCYNLPLGHLREQRLTRIWNGPDYRSFRRLLKKRSIFPGCRGCCMLEFRGAGRPKNESGPQG
jgi:radical SAM protein with 4Fe4S-binding SPASM domain